MNRIVTLVFLVIVGYSAYYIINLLIKKRITESFTTSEVAIPHTSPNLNIEDSHYFLTTAIMAGKVDIAELKEKNPHHSDYSYIDDQFVTLEQTSPEVVNRRPSQLSTPRLYRNHKLSCIGENDPKRQIVKFRQPYMYDEPEIINYYDRPYLRDWRYPERPIDLNFALNPQKYSEENPQIYPSYKYLSKW